MSVFIDGATLSSILYSHVNSEGNQEGVLLGQVVRQVKDHISDSQITNTQLHTFTYVASHIPWPREERVYSRGGVPIMEKMAALLGDEHMSQVVGWYSFRRNSTLRMSMKERTLHKHLQGRFSGTDGAQQFVFLMCVQSCTAQQSTHNVDHFFGTLTPGTDVVKKLSVSVTNLGDTVHTQYQTLAHSAATQSTAVQNILHNYRSQFLLAEGDVQEVQRINCMSKALNTSLQQLCQQVSETEQQAGELEREVARLRQELAQKEEQQQRAKQALAEKEEATKEDVEPAHLYPVLPSAAPVKEEEADHTTGNSAAMPSIDDLLSMQPTTATIDVHAEPDLCPLTPAPLDGSVQPPAVAAGPDGGGVLQSVVDTITDVDEDVAPQNHIASVPPVNLHQGLSPSDVTSPATSSAPSVSSVTSSPVQSKTAVKETRSAVSKSGTGNSSKDHFSFVDNLLSSESGGSSHRKSTATVPTGATLTYSPRTTRSQIKGAATHVSSAPSPGKERLKARNSPTRSAVMSQTKRDGSPKADGKTRVTTTSSTTRGSGSVSQVTDRRRGKVESGVSHEKSGQSTTSSNREPQNTRRQDAHSRLKLNPANFSLGGTRAKSRGGSKEVSAKVISKSDSEGEKMDGEPEDANKNGTADPVHEEQEAPLSSSPVF